MRLIKPIITALSLAIVPAVFGQQDVTENKLMTLSEYIREYPKCITKEVVYDGCTVLLNSDGEYLFGQFNILHPELQMRILMQGITFYVDPTGKKKEKYAIHFPAASAVENIMTQMAPPEPEKDMEEGVLPHIKPLVISLARIGAEYDINRRSQLFENTWSSINIADSTHCLSYSFIIPLERMLSEKKLSNTWKLGLYSEGGRPGNGGPGMDGLGMRGPGMGGPEMAGPGMDDPRMGGIRNEKNNSKVDLRKMMRNDIEVWIPFSFEEACSLEQNNEKE